MLETRNSYFEKEFDLIAIGEDKRDKIKNWHSKPANEQTCCCNITWGKSRRNNENCACKFNCIAVNFDRTQDSINAISP